MRKKIYPEKVNICEDRVIINYPQKIVATLIFDTADTLAECKTYQAMFNSFTEFSLSEEQENFALSYDFDACEIILIERETNEPYVFKPCDSNKYCFVEQYGHWLECEKCPNNINCDGWGGNHPCGQQVCEYSCTYCQYNNWCYAKEVI